MIREATAADVPAIAELELLSFPDDAWTADYLRLAAEGGLPTVSLLVAESEDGAVAGHLILSVVFEVAELQRIAVHPAYRRHGLGGDLLVEAVRRSAQAGVERLLLEVREGNAAALGLYAEAGFVEIDRRPRYYRDGATGVVLQLDLAPLG